ncbi:hypothetical protein DPMN_182791 [Dreissena polymorpha]|uniref:Uncharacterized protein n=1 Tax=Dreissena polymorpha TaxID=45954 RepID=A0A9D4DGC4_DREPO|nr:hypothetical protein DPMN_182791 [Dreissena polymorpha]
MHKTGTKNENIVPEAVDFSVAVSVDFVEKVVGVCVTTRGAAVEVEPVDEVEDGASVVIFVAVDVEYVEEEVVVVVLVDGVELVVVEGVVVLIVVVLVVVEGVVVVEVVVEVDIDVEDEDVDIGDALDVT